MVNTSQVGALELEALHRLTSTEPPLFLSPTPELSLLSRLASQYLFTSLKPYTPKSPFDHLLTDGFDAEQIWQQIDLQSQPLISTLRREIKRFQRDPGEILKFFGKLEADGRSTMEAKENGKAGLERGRDEIADDAGEGEGGGGGGDDDDEEDADLEVIEEEEGESEEEEEEEGAGADGGEGFEDKFLKIKELEEYLLEDEAKEYSLEKRKKGENGAKTSEDDEDEDEEDENLAMLGIDEDEEEVNLEDARYEDFFGSKGKASRRKSRQVDGPIDLNTEDEQGDDKKKEDLSTHEKELEKLQAEIEEMEKANLEPKAWTMQGEVTAAKRPKNSALEVDLDFEHNVRPPPVITEEVTASIEELIKKRIVEGSFDDVQRAPKLPSQTPREVKELDDNKSKKGLAEIYEEEYAQKTGLVSAPLSLSDELRKEASMLFKKLCLKLDALSHFHFAPKPVVEDLSVQANVPALAMEEIAPVAVSDAAMLAPEEVFAGKGDVKEEAELTQAERKRRRAKKKRKFKAEQAKRISKKARQSGVVKHDEGDFSSANK
ncbi:U3 snoRNP protein [Ancistrocladus abbreviatus]